MELAADLSEVEVAGALPGRPARVYPALLSTEAEGMAWARTGAAEGALVVAAYQASPRGRGGKPWAVQPEQGIGFSLILRPTWPIFREGWLYTVACCALADVMGDDTTIEWPDQVRRNGEVLAEAGVHVEPQDNALWAVVTVLIVHARPPRGPLLARAVQAIEAHFRAEPETVLEDYLARCETIGRRVRACMVPLGPAGPVIVGTAVNVLKDGALVLLTEEQRRVAVRPQNLGVLEDESPPQSLPGL